jgi:acetoin utilization deacetylase AcuC-like enzyme
MKRDTRSRFNEESDSVNPEILVNHVSMKTGLLLDPLYADHPGAGLPECPERYTAIMKALTGSGLLPKLATISTRAAEMPEIERCHPKHYIELARDEVAQGLDALSTGDTDICAKSYDVAIRAVGGVLNAVDAVMTGQLGRAFCAVRPPGHLLVQQHRARGTACAEEAWRREGGDRGLGRASRERHAGHLL